MKELEKRTRKPRARQTEIVWGALDERLEMLAEATSLDMVGTGLTRVRELIDELKRSLNGKDTENE